MLAVKDGRYKRKSCNKPVLYCSISFSSAYEICGCIGNGKVSSDRRGLSVVLVRGQLDVYRVARVSTAESQRLDPIACQGLSTGLHPAVLNRCRRYIVVSVEQGSLFESRACMVATRSASFASLYQPICTEIIQRMCRAAFVTCSFIWKYSWLLCMSPTPTVVDTVWHDTFSERAD
jgi:hypothetical protein